MEKEIMAKDSIVNGKKLKCLICGYKEFEKINTKLNKKWLPALDLELFSRRGIAYISKNCGFKHEFFK